MKNTYSLISKSLILLILSAITLNSFAQKGIPFITNYSLPISMSTQNYQIIQGDNNMMYVLNQNGLFSFDGYGWERMPIGGQPMTITFLEKLFVGGDQELGYFKKNLKGVNTYVTIEQKKSELFYLFYHFNNNLYAAGVDGIYRIRRVEPYKVDAYYLENDSTQIITDMFNVGDKFFVVKNKSALFQIYKQDATRINTSNFGTSEITFSFKHNNIQIVGTSSNKIFRFDGKNLVPIAIKDQNYIDASYLTGGISLNEKTIALSTLIGGCLIIDINTGETNQIVNYSSGLPDDEITSMAKDNFGGLWLIHGMGISRVDLSVPISSFHHIDGLRGNILSITKQAKDVYVGTSDGLYKLVETKKLTTKTIEYSPKKPTTTNQKEVQEKQLVTDLPNEKQKKGLFSRIFGKERTEQINLEQAEDGDQKSIRKATIRKKVRQLVSINFNYEKINGVSGKVNYLVNWNNNLLAASSTGLYSVYLDQPKSIIGNEYIFCINPSTLNKNNLYVGTWGVLYRVNLKNNEWSTKKLLNLNNEKITSVVELSELTLIISTDFKLYRIENVNENPKVIPITMGEHSVISPIVRKANNDYMVITPSNIFQYYPQADSIGVYPEMSKQGNYRAFYSNSDQTWLRAGQQWIDYPKTESNSRIAKYIGLLDRVNYVNYTDSNEVWVVNNFNQIYRINPTRQNDTLKSINLYIKQVLDKSGNSLNTNYVRLEPTNNAFKIKLGAPFYLKEKGIEYQYKLEGVMAEWTDWGNVPERDFPFFPPGNHTLKIRARDAMGNVSDIKEYPFSITPPFYQTIWFYLLVVALLIALITVFIRIREKNLIKEKQILEQKVKERTKTIEEQKDSLEKQRDELKIMNQEILQQKEEIEAQRDEITSQRDQIVSQNQDIIKSISYARRIQNAVMPSKDVTDNILKDYFILLKPRDIVSGDFFWMKQKAGKIIVAAADCTGHGVPGAFMSLLGITLLTEIVKNTDDIHPNIILNELRTNIKRALSQVGKEHEAKDGMDIALSVIDTNENKLMFAGAYNPLYLIRNNELIEFKGDKMPVGVHINEKESFTLREIPIQKNDCIYMFSDGYVDQFGGNDNRKFMTKSFKELLLKIADKNMQEQKSILDDTIDQWIGPHDQLDDILVMGIRF